MKQESLFSEKSLSRSEISNSIRQFKSIVENGVKKLDLVFDEKKYEKTELIIKQVNFNKKDGERVFITIFESKYYNFVTISQPGNYNDKFVQTSGSINLETNEMVEAFGPFIDRKITFSKQISTGENEWKNLEIKNSSNVLDLFNKYLKSIDFETINLKK